MHELAHIGHPRHDRVFWLKVDAAMPDWKLRSERLMREGPRYLQFEMSTEGP